IIHAEPSQAGIDLVQDRLARQAGAVRIVLAHLGADLGRDHQLLALAEILDRAAEDLLAGAERIDVRGVEEVDAELERLLDEGATVVLVEHPGTPGLGAVGHAAEADPRDPESGATQVDVVHADLPRLVCMRAVAMLTAPRSA